VSRSIFEERIADSIVTKNELLDLSRLALSDTDLSELASRSDSLAQVRRLILRANDAITDAGVTAVAERLAGLTQLYLRGCYLVTDAGVVAVAERLAGLTHLDLSWCNQVTDAGVKAVAERLAGLSRLDLSGSRVTDAGVKAVAERLAGLTQLDLSACDAVTDAGVAAVAERLAGLTQLDLSACGRVTDAGVKAVAERLAGLTKLNLSYCRQVTDAGVVAVAERLAGLTQLHLTECGQVTDAGVKAVAERLTGLTQLTLSGCNQVTDAGVMAVAERLAGLTQLHLSGCVQVTDAGVVAVAERLASLTELYLSMCVQVTDAGVVAVAERLAGLTQLHLSGCVQVTDAGVVAVAERLASLTELYLSGCAQVTDAGVVAAAERLDKLEGLGLGDFPGLTNAGFNQITSRLTRLTYLNLSGCRQLVGIPETIRNLADLKYLYLSNIPDLASLPRAIQSLARLEELNLSGNKALGLPVELIGRTRRPADILDYYFRAVQEGKKQLNEAKLLVVGNEAAGKTSLVNFLIHGTPALPTAKTPGVAIQERINVSKWDTEKSEDGNPLRLNVWDFGGQEVMYETHRFFLTARSLYLLVLEARRENARDVDEIVHEWMRTVRNKAGDPPVIIVVNKADNGQDLRLDETRLQAEYTSLVGFVRTSCLDPNTCQDGGKGIGELRQLIARTVREKLEHVRDWLPLSYFRVKEALGELARQESVLEAGAYRERCVNNSIPGDAEQGSLLALLDAIGVVVKYNEATLLDPNWLTTAVYRLLTHAEVAKAEGELTLDDLAHLLQGLPPEKYPRERWGFIIEMMRRFHLCFELQDQPGRFLIPELLNPNEPFLNWNEAESLRFRFGYDQLPHGLIPRFIVETHDLLPKQRSAWANGVILEIDQCRVLVRSNRKDRSVDVFVDGAPARCRGALAIVRDRFAKVHRLYAELNPRELVPLPDRPDLEVSYQDLVKLEELGQKQFLPPGAEKMYPVGDLLNKVDLGSRRRGPAQALGYFVLPPVDSEDDTDPVPHRETLISQVARRVTVRPEPLPLESTPSETPTKWWVPLVASCLVGIGAAIQTALFLFWDYKHPLPILTFAFLAVTGFVYVIQMRHKARVDHWAQNLAYLFFGLSGILASLPGIKLVADAKRIGKLEVLIDNSSWLAIVAMLCAVAFGILEYARERHRTSPT
jgi:small GTP-binding protein